MRALPVSVCLASLTAGVLLGSGPWSPAPAPAPAVSVAPAVAPEPAPAAAPAAPQTGKSLTVPQLQEYVAWLQNASVTDVYHDLLRCYRTDNLRHTLAVYRFLEMPAAERLQAMLEPRPQGAPNIVGGLDGLIASTAKDAIAGDPAGVAKLLSTVRFTSQDRRFAEIMAPLFARGGWDGCESFLQQLPPAQQAAARPALVGLLAGTDLPRAQTICQQTPEGPERNAVASAVAEEMMKTDPQGAFAWVLKNGQPTDDGRSYQANARSNPAALLMGQIFKQDPTAGAALLLENQNLFSGSAGYGALQRILRGWAFSDFPAASAWLEANPLRDDLNGNARAFIYGTNLKNLAPTDALSFYQNLSPELQRVCIPDLIERVGISALPGGLAAFRDSIPENARARFDSALRNRLGDLTSDERALAMTILGKKTDMSSYEVDSMVGSLSADEREKLQPTLSAEAQQALKVKDAELALSTGDFEKAQELLAEAGANPKNLLPHSLLAVSLAETDPDAAKAWIDTLAAGQARDTATVNVAVNLAKTDLAGAAQWVESMPASEVRDRVAGEIVRFQGLCGETESALKLAASIRDEGLRHTALAAATRGAWFADSQHAEQLLASQDLTPEQTREVVKLIQKGNPR